MAVWMRNLMREQAEEAFATADLPRLRSTINWLVMLEPLEPRWWNYLAEGLYQSAQWFDAALWCEKWRETWREHSAGNDDPAAANFFLARIEAQVGLLSSARQRLQDLSAATGDAQAIDPQAIDPQDIARLMALVDAESAKLEAQYGSVSLTLIVQAAWQQQDWQSLMLIARRNADMTTCPTDEKHHFGIAFYHAKHYVQALNYLAPLPTWSDEVATALAHALVNIGEAERAEAVLRKHFARQVAAAPARAGLLLRIHSGQGNELDCLKLLRHANEPAFKNALFVDAVEYWIGVSKKPQVIRDWLVAQNQRFASCASYWHLLGLLRIRCNDALNSCRASLERSLALQGTDALVWSKLAASHVSENNLEAAIAAYQQAIAIDASRATVWQELAMLLARRGDLNNAGVCFKRAVALAPNDGLVWSNYGNYLTRTRALQMAVECGREAVRLEPKSATCWNNLAAACLNQHYQLEAKAALDNALALEPTLMSAISNQARTTGQLGEFDTALALFEAIPNKDVRTCSSMLFYANYHPDLTSEAIYAIYRRVIDHYFPPQHYFTYRNSLETQRPLVIGYVSPDFRHHSCFNFIAPLFAHHSPATFRLIAYSDVAVPDAHTQQLRAACEQWRDIATLSDEQVAEMIRDDGVDILVDLAGHTSDNRLSLFALKPVPLQMTWLGFGYTTGLRQIDYFLTDDEMFPHGAEALFAEAPARIGVPSYTYQAPLEMPAISDTPALQSGVITFGSLSRTVRLNHRCLMTWITLLQRVPNSRLLLNSFSFAEPAMRTRFFNFFAQRGIAANRLDIGFESPPWPVYRRVDIMLDCFPHNSGTTLFEGLYMGIPFITRRDRISMGRLGATIARGIGHPEWIADSDDAYIEKAVELSSNIAALADLRQRLRGEMQASAICDHAGFTRRVEAMYRQIWATHCARSERQLNIKSLA